MRGGFSGGIVPGRQREYPPVRPVQMHVAVQMEGGAELFDQRVDGRQRAVRVVGPRAGRAGGVGEQNVGECARFRSAAGAVGAPGFAHHPPCAPHRLGSGPLVGAGGVAPAAAEACDAQSGDVDDVPVGGPRAIGAGPGVVPSGAQPSGGRESEALQGRVVVAGHHHAGHVEGVGDRGDVGEVEVPGGQQQVRPVSEAEVDAAGDRQCGAFLVGDGQDGDRAPCFATLMFHRVRPYANGRRGGSAACAAAGLRRVVRPLLRRMFERRGLYRPTDPARLLR